MRLCFFALLLSIAEMLVAGNVPPAITPGMEWRYTFRREGEPSVTFTRRIVDGADHALHVDALIDGVSQSLHRPDLSELEPPSSAEASGGSVAGLEVRLAQSDAGEEEVEVPAGKFRARRFHGEQPGLRRTVVDRWYADGVGWVKETVTQRGPSGALLARNSLELLNVPGAAPATAAASAAPVFQASISTSSQGDEMKVIPENALQIVARWRIHSATSPSQVRAVWIAEDVQEVAPHNFQIDEAIADLSTAEGYGAFTLSRPPDGWAPGRYRVDFFLGQEAIGKVSLTVAAAPTVAGNN